MRILHVNKFLYRRGGAEAYMEDVAAQQDAQGHTTAFFGMHHPSNTHLGLSRHFPQHLEMEPPPPGLDKLRVAARTLWSTSAASGLRGAIEEFKPDLIHYHNVYHQLSPSVVVAGRRAGVPAVMTVHDFKLVCPSYLMLDSNGICEACIDGGFSQAIKRRCKNGSLVASSLLAVESTLHRRLKSYEGISAFICPSNFLQQKLLAGGVYPDRLRVVNNFVDVPAEVTWQGPEGPLVFIGRLEAYKGVHVLIEALAHLPAQYTVQIAGEGPDRERLEQLAATVAPGRVTFLGRLPKEGVAALMSGASAVVVPSLWYENQPLVVLEAMAAGVPVLGSDLGGTIELIEPTGGGRLFAAGDPVDLAKAATDLLDPQAARSASAAGRAAALRQFSPAVHLSALTSVYSDVLAAHPRRAAS